MKKKLSVVCLLLAMVLLCSACNPFALLTAKKEPQNQQSTFLLPHLSGKTFLDEESFLAQYPALHSLNISVIRQWDDTHAENVIISTSPEAGTRMAPGEALKITVSRGIHMVEIPQITSDEMGDAYMIRLQNAGFTVVHNTVFSDEIVKDYVVRTEPSYPASVPYGSTVTVFISSGSENGEATAKSVPNVDQLTEQAARQALEEAGFVVGTVTTVNHPEYSAGMVAGQEPAADTVHAVGGVVNLQIASGYRDVELALPLPETNSVISLEVFIDGKMQTRPEYSSDLKNILPSAISTLYFTFDEQIASYKVTFRIKESSMPSYQIYANYTVNALTGEWTQDALYPLTITPTTTTTTAEPITIATTTLYPDDTLTTESPVTY